MKTGGFTLPAVLGITLIAAVLSLHAAGESSTATALATMRVLQQRAFAASDRGLHAAMATLANGGRPPATQTLTSSARPGERAEVGFAELIQVSAPAGFSAGSFVEHHFELRSVGFSARGTTVAQVQGVSRLEPRQDVAPGSLGEGP